MLIRGLALLVLVLFAAKPVPAATYYVTPSGTGTASLTGAKAAAVSGDTIYLRGGTYHLASTLTFGAADSGVTWAAYPGETPVISGAIQVTSWTQVGSTGIWQASVPPGTVTRQLYVNGKRATRSFLTSPNRFTTSDNGLTYTSTDSTIPTFAPPITLEVSNAAMPWVMNRVSVASVTRVGSTTTLTMDGAAAGWNGVAPAFATWTAAPFAVENAYELLSSSTPGCWYLNSSTNTLYYVPRAGEDMSTADVELPVLSSLISSSQGDQLSNVQFRGIVFEGTGWTLPTTQKSFMQIQADMYLVKGSWANNVNGYIWSDGKGAPAVAGSVAFPPGAVALQGAQNVGFYNCTFRHLGGTGVYLGIGSKNCTLDRNTISDVSASAVQVGEIDNWAPATIDQVSNVTITNNTITDVAKEYQGGVGVFGGYVDNCKINHNDISGIPHTAVSLGWGWNVSGYTAGYANGNEVGWNKIHNVMNLLYDGGGVYTQGVQGASVGLSIHDNYFYDFAVKVADTHKTGGEGAPLYGDQGSNYVAYSNNVISKNPASVCPYWSLFNVGGNTGTQTINASSNYAASGLTEYVAGGITNGGTIATPTAITGTDSTGWPTAAQTIAAASGPTAVVAYGATRSTANMRASFR